jgi:hypothetical protein
MIAARHCCGPVGGDVNLGEPCLLGLVEPRQVTDASPATSPSCRRCCLAR